jgi:hypothetical protein
MHHNPIPTYLGPLDQIRLLDDARFRQVIGANAAKIRHIFFCHCHLPIAGSTAGVPTTSLRGTNHAWIQVFSLAFDEGDALGFGKIQRAQHRGLRYVTVHMVEYGYSGGIRAEGRPTTPTWDRRSMKR